MTIGEMHGILLELKNQGQVGYHPREIIDRALNMGSYDKHNQEKSEFERTQKISGDLAPFKTRSTINLTAGVGSLPALYDYATNASTTGNLIIDIVPEAEWLDRINDPIAVPDATHPIMAIRSDISVIPTSLTSVYLYYLRRPVDMSFAYSQDGDGNITQNVGSSVNCDWPPSCHVDIILRACGYLGVSLNEDMLLKLKSFKAQTERV